MPSNDENFNARELYYSINGGEFKLLPIKPLTELEIQIEQDKLPVPVGVDLSWQSICTSSICYGDEFFTAIEAIEHNEMIGRELYIICEMAKRYIYLLNELQKEKDNEQV